MSRQLRITMPLMRKEQILKVVDMTVIIQKNSAVMKIQKTNYDSHHGVCELTELCPDELVWIKDRNEKGKVVEKSAPRS